MKNNFERELPEDYKQIFHINLKDTKTGVIFTVLSIVPLFIVLPIAFAIVSINGFVGSVDLILLFQCLVGGVLVLIAYMALFQLAIGLSYKVSTKEKLTFGFTWSSSYCGVPHIYVYRRTALFVLITPTIVFSLIFIALTVLLYFVHTYLFYTAAVVLSVHLGASASNIYTTFLYLLKFKDNSILMRDIGPEQFFYAKE